MSDLLFKKELGFEPEITEFVHGMSISQLFVFASFIFLQNIILGGFVFQIVRENSNLACHSSYLIFLRGNGRLTSYSVCHQLVLKVVLSGKELLQLVVGEVL